VKLLWVGLFSAAILFSGLGKTPLWDRDETEYAQSAVEMQSNNEWLIPTLEGQPFIEKPILLFWLVRLSYMAFGVNEFAARFPAALFGVLTCLAAGFLGKTLYGARAGFWSGMVLSSMILFAGGFRLLLTDPFFVFFTTLALAFYARSSLFLSYLFTGLAVLAKGPIGLFPAGVFMVYEWAQNRYQLDGRVFKSIAGHAACAALSCSIAAPWFLYSMSKEKAATTTFFAYDNLARFFQSFEGHSGPAFYYVIVLALGTLPWTFHLIAALKKSWRERGSQSLPMQGGDLLLAVWTVVLFVFFSVSATKLPHYMFPVLPALACWIGKLIAEEPQREKSAARICGGTLVFVLFAVFVLLPKVDSYRVMKPIGLALKANTPPEAKVYGYFVSEPSLFFYGGRLFPFIEQGSLDDLLSQKEPVYVITKESRLNETPPKVPFKIVERAKGFAENGGKMTVLLLSNQVQ